MDLAAWNKRLDEHFRTLAHDRKAIPVFALEHGLTESELVALQNELRSHIRAAAPARAHQLVWIVYASEIGYGYAGDEYWQTFEEKTPGWTDHGSRAWLRDAFTAFRSKYAGAEPSGPWAEHFSIIAWPITHAILPRDLQQQLAKLLYECRHNFSGEHFDQPQRLGEFIAARSWNASARFRNLVQAPSLVGQIAAALLLQGNEGFTSLLHSATLKRISDDVDRERRGREWLSGARRVAAERAAISGVTFGKPLLPVKGKVEDGKQVVRLGIEPRLVLRPTEGSRWEISLEVPDLSRLVDQFPRLRETLTESRLRVAGVDRPLARGRCLLGPQRVALSEWPHAADVLLKFERTDPHLEYLLRTECMLRPGSSWLFKIASDGLAYESRGMSVRAGAQYILLSVAPFARLQGVHTVELTCRGVHAVRFDLPSALTEEWEQTLKQLRITQLKTIDVWPVGLGALTWDESGYSEWIASETPIIAVRSDHVIEQIVITTGQPAASITLLPSDLSPGVPVFLELPQFNSGSHELAIEVQNKPDAGAQRRSEARISMRVRDAIRWTPEFARHELIRIELDPVTPTLQQLWEGRAKISVHGPAARLIKCRVRLWKNTGDIHSFEMALPNMRLPVTPEDWSTCFKTGMRKANDAQNAYAAQDAYDSASKCEICINADELGQQTIVLERAFTPVRWMLRRNPSNYVVRLHNDAGADHARVERYQIDRPIEAERLGYAPEYHADVSGGLYVASVPRFRSLIIVPPFGSDILAIRRDPKIGELSRSADSAIKLLGCLTLWSSAHLTGNLWGSFYQRKVTDTIETRLRSLLCGKDWVRAEESLQNEHDLAELKRHISGSMDLAELGTVIQLDRMQLARLSPKLRTNKLTLLAKEYRIAPRLRPTEGVGTDYLPWFVEFALRVASDPVNVEEWSGSSFGTGVQLLLDTPELLRVARYLVLAVHHHQKATSSAGDKCGAWEWQ